MSITEKYIEKVALLSRLYLTAEEKRAFTQDLNKILDYLNKINELDTSNVQPTSHVFPIRNISRVDEIKHSTSRDIMLKNAPKQEDGFFSVPPVIE